MNKIIKHLILFASLLLIFSGIQGQDIVFADAEFIKGNGIDRVSDLFVDRSDNLYIAGSFEKDVNLSGIKMPEKEHQSIFIVKYDSNGKIQYNKQISGSGTVNVHSLCCDKERNLYISGTFRKKCLFGDILIKADNWQDNFIAKLAPDGTFISAKHINANTKDNKTFLICNSDNHLFFVGSFYKRLKIDNKEIKSTSASDIFIAELNSDLNLINLKSIHGKNKLVLKDINCSENNNLFITGYFNDKINFDGKILSSVGRKDIFLAEINTSQFSANKDFVKQIRQYGSCRA